MVQFVFTSGKSFDLLDNKKVVNIICSGWEKFVNWVDKNELMETVIFMIVINLTFIIVFFHIMVSRTKSGFQ